jgi:polysaccharide pyruvyl transferase WcaK-like protein
VPNLGDEAIFDAIDTAAPKLGARITAFSTRSAGASDPRAVRPRGLGIFGYLKASTSSDRVVLGGGGILKDEGLGPLLELLLAVVLARISRRQTALLSVGVGPFYSRTGRHLVGLIARLSETRTVRDEESARALEAIGVGPPTVVSADPVFTIDPPAFKGEGGGAILVSVRPWFHKDADGALRWEGFRDAVAAALSPVVEDNPVEFIALYRPQDEHAAGDVRSAMEPAGEALSVSSFETWAQLLERVAGSSLVVAMRYHVLLAAAVAERPAIAIAYEPKVTALAGELSTPAIAPDDPDLATKLSALIRGGAVPVPDRAATARLRARAWDGLRLALGSDGRE